MESGNKIARAYSSVSAGRRTSLWLGSKNDEASGSSPRKAVHNIKCRAYSSVG